MKRVLSVAAIALLFAGCGDNKSETKEHTQSSASAKTVVEKKVEEKKVSPVKESVAKENKSQKAIVVAVDGAQIFKSCASCHGAKAQNHALGKSKIIAGWKSEKIVNALHGYKDGSYGGAMKAVMKGQASKLSDTEIKAVADYISKL